MRYDPFDLFAKKKEFFTEIVFCYLSHFLKRTLESTQKLVE